MLPGFTSIFSSAEPTVIDSLDKLSDSQMAALNSVQAFFQGELKPSPEEILGYLKAREFNVMQAKSQLDSTLRWRSIYPAPKIHEIAPFLRSDEGCEGPDGAVFLLEKKGTDCVRDMLGRPVLVSIGMLHGSALEMQRQMVYALNRAREYYLPGKLQSTCTIIEVEPRKGAITTFRFPDKETKSLMDLQKQHFPGTLSSTTYFCGIPSVITWAFKLCKPFMDPEAYANMVLKPDYSHLPLHLAKEDMLRQWGGELTFSLDEYISWRAEEEGVSHLLTKEVRRFTSSSTSSNDETFGDASSIAEITSEAITLGDPAPRRIAKVHKQGSGAGLFANYKWKEKLMSVGPGGVAIYFDSVEISTKNKAARVIPLTGSYVEPLETGIDDKSFGFQIVSPSRNFAFSCELYHTIIAFTNNFD